MALSSLNSPRTRPGRRAFSEKYVLWLNSGCYKLKLCNLSITFEVLNKLGQVFVSNTIGKEEQNRLMDCTFSWIKI